MSKPFGAETGTFREIQASIMAADARASAAMILTV